MLLAAKFFNSSHDEDREAPWLQNPMCTKTVTSSQERWTKANSVSGHNLLEQTLLNTYATCVTFDGPYYNLFICLGL